MLVVGFEGYGGRGVNPAAEIVTALDGRTIAGRAVKGAVLPVRCSELAARLAAEIDEHDPSAMICLGLWPGEAMIRLERTAANINDFEIPDNAGVIETGPIDPEGPASYLSTLPLAEIQKRLLAAGIPARMSSTAGNFLCNMTMYCALRHIEKRGTAAACGFIHLPYLPAQVADLVASIKAEQLFELHQRADTASMSLDVSLRAIEIAAEATLETAV